MTEQAKNPEPAVKPKAESPFDDKAALVKLDEVEKSHNEVIGKPNFNPFFILTVVNNLRAIVKRGASSPEVLSAIKALPPTPVPVDPAQKELTEEAPAERVIKSQVPPTHAPGLKLPSK